MFIGKHGVGKTAVILEAFKASGLRSQYFSASTMDPWVDFIGVPKEVTKDGKTYLDLVRPKHFQDDEVDAIFLDEYNRSSKKVRNAVMELIQFKSINGKKFNNLKVVWVAINPSDEDGNQLSNYDVEELDPAQRDRFHVHINIPYQPSKDYFDKKYGDDISRISINWWNGLNPKEKDLVSPRRLDYAMEMYNIKGNIRDVIPHTIDVNKLLTELATGLVADKLMKYMKEGKTDEAREFINDESNYVACESYIKSKSNYYSFFLPILPEEKISSLMHQEKKVAQHVFANVDKFYNIVEEIAEAASGNLAAEANAAITKAKMKRRPDVMPVTFSDKSLKAMTSKCASRNETLKTIKTSDQSKEAIKFFNDNMAEDLNSEMAAYSLQCLTEALTVISAEDVVTGFPYAVGLINHAIKYHFDNGLTPKIEDARLKYLKDKYPGLIYNYPNTNKDTDSTKKIVSQPA